MRQLNSTAVLAIFILLFGAATPMASLAKEPATVSSGAEAAVAASQEAATAEQDGSALGSGSAAGQAKVSPVEPTETVTPVTPSSFEEVAATSSSTCEVAVPKVFAQVLKVLMASGLTGAGSTTCSAGSDVTSAESAPLEPAIQESSPTPQTSLSIAPEAAQPAIQPASIGDATGTSVQSAGLGRSDSSSASGSIKPAETTGSIAASGNAFRVIATAEGLIGGRTATGSIIKKWSEGAALPSRKALGRNLSVTYLSNGTSSSCKVDDVGPWNTRDPYWEKANGRPQAETGRDTRGRRTNRAGIDLYNATWYRLLNLRSYDRRLIENTTGEVEWQFNG